MPLGAGEERSYPARRFAAGETHGETKGTACKGTDISG